MKIGVLGTGEVGRTHAAALQALGHEVTIGTRDPAKADGAIRTATFADTVRAAELVINALNGAVAVEVLAGLAEDLAGTVVIDLSNPLDFSSGELRLFVCNSDSLGEQVQRAIPDAHVVKTLATVNVTVQVDPGSLADGDHVMFVAGNDADAKASVTGLLNQYGWRTVIDLGDLSAARSIEMMVPMWVRLYQTLGTARFNYRLVVEDG